jgi:hypothetical protein
MKFGKKPVVIEAFRFMGGLSYDEMLVEWGEDFGKVARHNKLINELVIKTLEGHMRANVCDWIIRGVKGEFYPCKPDIFEATYEPVEPTPREG